VSYLRGLFPEETFKAVQMRNLDGERKPPRSSCAFWPAAAALLLRVLSSTGGGHDTSLPSCTPLAA